MLELDDIQALFIAPPRYPFGRYTFLSFDSAEAGRAWLAQLVNQIPSAKVGLDAHASGVGARQPCLRGVHGQRAARARCG